MTNEDAPSPKQKLTRSQWVAVTCVYAGIICAVLAVSLLIRPQKVIPPTTNQPAVSAAQPSQQEIAEYKVAQDLPKYINLPAINQNKVRVFSMGLAKNNTIAAPANIFDAGWYNASAKPGQTGAVFIYGHVSSWEANGAFHDLKKLKAGDKVSLTRGDDQTLTYKVVSSETYSVDNVPMDKVLQPITAGQQGLNLMTCAGQVIKDTNDFTERLVVYTSLVTN